MDEFVLPSQLERIRIEFNDLLDSPAWSGQVFFPSITDNCLTVQVINRFVRDWIKENYWEQILSVCKREFGSNGEARMVVVELPPVAAEVGVQNFEPLQKKPEPVLPPLPLEAPKVVFSSLNKKYTFQSYVVGTSNQFAHAASAACAQQPGQVYNPLLIYGGVGLGKTHLLHAIGNEILQHNPSARVLYISSERFMNELIQAIRSGKTSEFRNKYRDSCDVLLMDDVQFIAGKDRTQDEFFHTFNTLYESHKQIVLTSDKPPKDIPDLEDRLRSRLEWGLIADIQPPDLETRIAILKKKACANHIELTDDVALFLGSHIKSNVRELEGALIRVNAFASLGGKAITVDFTKESLKNVLGVVGKILSMDQIQKIVSDFYGITLNELTGKCRVKSQSYPRQIAMYLCRKFVKASYPEIGHKFGGKDHSTVVHAVTKITDLIDVNAQLRDEMVSLERQLNH